MKYRIFTFFFVILILCSSANSVIAREFEQEFPEFLTQWGELHGQLSHNQGWHIGIESYPDGETKEEIDIYYRQDTSVVLIEINQSFSSDESIILRFLTTDRLEEVYVNLPEVIMGMNPDKVELNHALKAYEDSYVQINFLDFKRVHFQGEFLETLIWSPRTETLAEIEGGKLNYFDKGWTLQQESHEIPQLLYDYMGDFYWSYDLAIESTIMDGQVDIEIDQSIRHEQNRKNIEFMTNLEQQVLQEESIELTTQLSFKDMLRRPIKHVLYMRPESNQYRISLTSLVDYVDTTLDSEKGLSLENTDARLIYEVQPFHGSIVGTDHISRVSLEEIEIIFANIMNNSGAD